MASGFYSPLGIRPVVEPGEEEPILPPSDTLAGRALDWWTNKLFPGSVAPVEDFSDVQGGASTTAPPPFANVEGWATPGPSTPLPVSVQSGEGPRFTTPVPEPSVAEPIATTRRTGYSAMRAIRLPNGQMLFTNRPEYGGEEMTPAEGGREVRRQQAAEIDPASATMSALVKASARAAMQRGEGSQPAPQGRVVPGEAPSMTPGGFSQIEGTPQQQARYALEDAMTALNLAGIQGEEKKVREEAAMSPVERAQMENRDVVLSQYILKNFEPRLRMNEEERAAKIAELAKTAPPDSPQWKVGKQRIDDYHNAVRDYVLDLIGTVSRQRLAQSYP